MCITMLSRLGCSREGLTELTREPPKGLPEAHEAQKGLPKHTTKQRAEAQTQKDDDDESFGTVECESRTLTRA